MKILVNFGLLLAIACTFLLFRPIPAHAFDPTSDICQSTPSATVCQDANNGKGKNPIFGNDGIITKIVRLLALLTGIAAVVIIVIGGFRFVESGGNPEKAANARSTVLYAVVGLIVAGLAQTIVIFVLSKL